MCATDKAKERGEHTCLGGVSYEFFIFALETDLVRFLEAHDLLEPLEADVTLFKKLVLYYSYSRDGRLDELVSVSTVLSFWRAFTSAYRLQKMQVPKDMITEVKNVKAIGEQTMISANRLYSTLRTTFQIFLKDESPNPL